jgi:NAD-dependent deacetylase
MDFPPDLISSLRSAHRVAVLTGAGVSQESGLRTFRDANDGVWRQYRPEDLASPAAFARDPHTVWEWYAMRRQKLGSVQPNPGHYALVEMAGYISDFHLITQNVDDLHRKAGSSGVIELHGNLGRVKCASCGVQVSEWAEVAGEVPHCQTCGGVLRPDVVWFGESLPRAELEAAVEAARACQVFFSIGTSGLVQPAAALAHAARNRGALLVEVNAELTPLTPKTDFAFHGKSGEILPELVEATWGA